MRRKDLRKKALSARNVPFAANEINHSLPPTPHVALERVPAKRVEVAGGTSVQKRNLGEPSPVGLLTT